MAERRMFAKKIIDDDWFLDLPSTARLLYYDLSMRADDDGFVSPKKVMRMTGASQNDLDVLIAKRFILPFESGVVVIRQWHVHNLIRADRYQPTVHLEEKSMLLRTDTGYVIESNTQNVLDRPEVTHRLTNGQPSIGKDRLGKDSIGYSNNSSLFDDEIDEFLDNQEETTGKPSRPKYEEEFEEVWKLYPSKTGKSDAMKSYIKARKGGVSKELIVQKIEEYKTYVKVKYDGKYIKNGSSWFHQKGWEDEYPVVRQYDNGTQCLRAESITGDTGEILW